MPGSEYVGMHTPYARSDASTAGSTARELVTIGAAANGAAAGVGLTTGGDALFRAANDLHRIGGSVTGRADLAEGFSVLPFGAYGGPGDLPIDGGAAPPGAEYALQMNLPGSTGTYSSFLLTGEAEIKGYAREFSGEIFVATDTFPNGVTIATAGLDIQVSGEIPPSVFGPYGKTFEQFGGNVDAIGGGTRYWQYELPPGADPAAYTADAVAQLQDLVQNGSYDLDDLNLSTVDELVSDLKERGAPISNGIRFNGGAGLGIDSSETALELLELKSGDLSEKVGESPFYEAFMPNAAGQLNATVAVDQRWYADGSTATTVGLYANAEGEYAGPDLRDHGGSSGTSGWHGYGTGPVEPAEYAPYASDPAAGGPDRRAWPLVQGIGAGEFGGGYEATTVTLPDGTVIKETSASGYTDYSGGDGTVVGSPIPGFPGVPSVYQDSGADSPAETTYVTTCFPGDVAVNERGLKGVQCESVTLTKEGDDITVGARYSDPKNNFAVSGEYTMQVTETTGDNHREWTKWEWEPHGTGPYEPPVYDKYQPQPVEPPAGSSDIYLPIVGAAGPTSEPSEIYLPIVGAAGPAEAPEPSLIQDMPPLERERLYLQEPELIYNPGQERETYIVEEGDNFWYVAEEMTALANGGEPVADAEFTEYWNELQELNYDNLRVEGNPDLIWAGQEMTLPGETSEPTWRPKPQ